MKNCVKKLDIAQDCEYVRLRDEITKIVNNGWHAEIQKIHIAKSIN